MSDRSVLILIGQSSNHPSVGEIEEACMALCEGSNLKMDFRQTDDHEELFRWIIESDENSDALIISPADAFQAESAVGETYQSAMKILTDSSKPFIEVHMDNIFSSESGAVTPLQEPGIKTGLICGLGRVGYQLAIKTVSEKLQRA